MYDDEVQALGLVPLEGRGSLPFALVHGESLIAAASWAVGEAGVQLFDDSVAFETVRDSGRPLLLHDPLCPLAPADLLSRCVEVCVETDRTVVGFRAVTDTVKQVAGDSFGGTVDRTGLRQVTSPIVIPGSVLSQLERLDAADFASLVADLAELGEIAWVETPAIARRVAGEADLLLLEALSLSLA